MAGVPAYGGGMKALCTYSEAPLNPQYATNSAHAIRQYTTVLQAHTIHCALNKHMQKSLKRCCIFMKTEHNNATETLNAIPAGEPPEAVVGGEEGCHSAHAQRHP